MRKEIRLHKRVSIAHLATSIMTSILLISMSLPGGAATDDPTDDLANDPPPPLFILLSMVRCCPEWAWPEAENAILEEMSALGFRVEAVDSTGYESETQSHLSRIATENNAVSAVEVTQIKGEIKGEAALWVKAYGSKEAFFQRYVAESGDEESDAGVSDGEERDDASVIGLKIAEAMRARLLEISFSDKKPSEPKSPPSNEVKKEPTPTQEPEAQPARETQEPPPEPLVLGVGVGAVAEGSPNGEGVIGAVDITVNWLPLTLLMLELDASISVVGSDVQHAGDTVTIDMAFVRLWALWEILQKGRFRPAVGVGSGVVISWSNVVSANNTDKSDNTVITYVGAVGRTGIMITKHVWIRFGLRVGLFAPQLELYLPDSKEAEASWGLPMLEGYISLEARFL